MGRFTVRKTHFGNPTEDPDEPDDNGEGLPALACIKLAVRRAAGIAEAKAILEHVPGPGESVHVLFTARLDLTDVINALLGKLGPCDRMAVATLGFNRKNLRAMLGWLDSGAVRSLSLVASLFWRAHNAELWTETQKEFRDRGQRVACCHSHAKVIALSFASGELLCGEGSANLCGSGSGREQFALVNDATLHAWHAGWIDALVTKHEGEAQGK